MELLFERSAQTGLRHMPRKQALALLERLKRIAADPFGTHPYAKRLVGAQNAFRVRQGDWRAVHRVDRERNSIHVEQVAHRGEVYR